MMNLEESIDFCTMADCKAKCDSGDRNYNIAAILLSNLHVNVTALIADCVMERCEVLCSHSFAETKRHLTSFNFIPLPLGNAPSCCPIDLISELERSFTSPRPGVTESVQYSLASLRLHPNCQASRTCSPSGEWGPVDVSGCTFRCRENVSVTSCYRNAQHYSH